ncbi:MAG: hypothetical protein ABSB28_11810 [Candidatus Bathyarchaeia archaeon]
MSRKKAKKSNTPQIGIFIDKKSANYNRLILEILFSQQMEAWQIAEAILRKKDPNISKEIKEVRRYHTQKIYSVIQRKNGRLEDLRNKGYIGEENGVWNLTKKGFIALSIEKPDLVNNEIQKNKNLLLESFQKRITSMPNGMAKVALGIHIDFSEIKPYFEKVDKLSLFHMFIEEAKTLLSEGIELDRISESDFEAIVMNKLSFSKKA